MKHDSNKQKATKKIKKRGPGRGRPGGNPDLIQLGKPHRWKPGESGNPSGRPKNHYSVTQQFRKQFDMPASVLIPAKERAIQLGLDPDTCTIGDIFALSVISDAIGGKDGIIKEVINRMDGKSPDVILNGILEETKTSLDAITDEQLQKMIRRDVSTRNGGSNKKPKRKAATRKKTDSSRTSKKKSG